MPHYCLGGILAAAFWLCCSASTSFADELPDRLHSAKQKLQAGEIQQAVEIFEQIESQGKFGSRERIEARAFLFTIRTNAGQCDFALGIDILFESIDLEPVDRRLYDELQFSIVHTLAISQPIASLDRGQSIESGEQTLEEKNADLKNRMIERGIQPGVVRLTDFWKVVFAAEQGRLLSAREILTELTPVVDSPSAAIQWKALLLNKWADIHIQQRHLAAALDACRRFSELAEQSQDPVLKVVSQDQMAHVLLRMGDYANAKRLLDETRESQSNFLQAMHWRINMAKALEGERQFLAARNLLAEGLNMLTALPDIPTSVTVTVMNNLGLNNYLMGEFEPAVAMLDKSRQLLERREMAKQLIVAESMINQGWIELARERPQNAVQHFNEASSLVADIADQNHPRYAEALAGASRAYLALDDRTNATLRIRQAEELAYGKLVLDLQSVLDPRDRIAILQETRVHPESIAWPGVFDTYLELAGPLELPVSEQLEVVLRWKGILGRLENATKRDVVKKNLAEVEAIEKELSEIYFRPVSLTQRKKRQEEIQTLEGQLRQLRRGIASHGMLMPGWNSGRQGSATLDSLAADRAVLVIVHVRTYRQPAANAIPGSSGELIGFLAAKGVITRLAFGDATELESSVVQWQEYVVKSHPEERAAARRVAQQVQRPLLPGMHGIHRIAIQADGICHFLPWAALPGVEGAEYWIENIAIEHATDWPTMEASLPVLDKPSLVAVGDVDYGPLSDSWARLPATLREIQDIQRIFKERFAEHTIDVLQAGRADKLSVSKLMLGKTYLHFATHAFWKRGDMDSFSLVDATSLLDTGLIFAALPDNPTVAGQYLTAGEVLQLDLESVELVVLSACKTGLGKLKAGQGIDGLVSSFHTAGAEQVVSSLWEVGDAETAELMRRFYRHLWLENRDATDALRAAQIELIRSSDSNPDWKKPFVWSAFAVSRR